MLAFYADTIALMGEHRFRVMYFIKQHYCGFYFIIMIAQQSTVTNQYFHIKHTKLIEAKWMRTTLYSCACSFSVCFVPLLFSHIFSDCVVLCCAVLCAFRLETDEDNNIILFNTIDRAPLTYQTTQV